MLSDGTYNYTYDDEGNLLTRTEIATGEQRTFEWDHRNRLVSVTDRSSGGTLLQRVKFTYDSQNRRLSKSVESPGNDEVTTHFVHDREDVILDFVEDNSGTNLGQRYLHGPDIDQVFAQEDGSGNVLWLTADHLGTTRDLINNAGQVVQHLQYDSFGNVLQFSGNSLSTTRLFTGREWDNEIDALYMRSRYYLAEQGVFASEDHIGFFSGDSNFYRYVGNSPNSYVDPLGTSKLGLKVADELLACAIQLRTGFPSEIAGALSGASIGVVEALAFCPVSGPAAPGCAVTKILTGATLGFLVPSPVSCPPPPPRLPNIKLPPPSQTPTSPFPNQPPPSTNSCDATGKRPSHNRLPGPSIVQGPGI